MFTSSALKATGALAIACAMLSVATIWAVLNDPIAVATAVNEGDLSAAFTLITRALTRAVVAVLRYL